MATREGETCIRNTNGWNREYIKYIANVDVAKKYELL